MALLPDRHPQKDFFILDISDVVPKDDMASMEHPLFSLATQPDMRHLVYRSGENSLEIIPSGLGLPTIKDKDILIFCISQLMDRKNRGEAIGKRVRFSARELMIGTNRNTDARRCNVVLRRCVRIPIVADLPVFCSMPQRPHLHFLAGSPCHAHTSRGI